MADNTPPGIKEPDLIDIVFIDDIDLYLLVEQPYIEKEKEDKE